MPLYTFYPCRADGVSLGFEMHALADDAAAAVSADSILEGHRSAAYVTGWCDDRPVVTRSREDAAPQHV